MKKGKLSAFIMCIAGGLCGELIYEELLKNKVKSLKHKISDLTHKTNDIAQDIEDIQKDIEIEKSKESE